MSDTDVGGAVFEHRNKEAVCLIALIRIACREFPAELPVLQDA